MWVREWIARRDNPVMSTINTLLHRELRYEDPESFSNFAKMDSEMFDEFLNRISLIINKKDIAQCVKPFQLVTGKFAVTLCFLADRMSFKCLSYSTRIAHNTISLFVPETLNAVVTMFEDEVIKYPSTPSEWENVAEGFYLSWQYPHCIAAMDGKHINFRPYRCDGSQFRNYKGRVSIVLLAVVDSAHKFLYVDIGKNGRMHDANVFREFTLCDSLISGALNLPKPCTIPGNADPMPHVIVADSAFPLRENIMKPYPERSLTAEQRIYNYRHSRARRISENAFGMLANKFGVLLTDIRLPVGKVELITNACCMLHNLILMPKTGKYIPSEEEFDVLPKLSCVQTLCGNRSTRGSQKIRDKFCQFFNSICKVDWQDGRVKKGCY